MRAIRDEEAQRRRKALEEKHIQENLMLDQAFKHEVREYSVSEELLRLKLFSPNVDLF